MVVIENSSPKRTLNLRLATVTLGAIVVIAAVLIGVSLTSGSPLPVLRASYQCVPGALIPQLKPGQSGTMTASYGAFTATFRATKPRSTSATPQLAGMPFKGTLTVSEGGQSWTLPPAANPNVAQVNALCVIAFQREQHPGVMIEGFSGGAHCCEAPVVYVFNVQENRYVKVVDLSPNHLKDSYVFNANEGLVPMVAGSQVLLTTGDDSFSYAFGCYACSETPLVLYAVDPDGLFDVSSKHPALIAVHARSLLKSALAAVKDETATTQSFPAPFGFLAPWVADECEIGHGASAFSEVEELAHEGKLSNSLYYQATTKRSGSFVLDLRSFLLSDGYCTGQI